MPTGFHTRLAIGTLIFSSLALLVVPCSAQDAPQTSSGARAFDFEFGTWRTQLRVLIAPLSGSNEWAEFEGTSVVRPVLDGQANMVELRVEGPTGRIRGASLRLYDPEARQWSLHYANMRTGRMGAPVVGSFSDRRGEFYGHERINGRMVLVRFIISDITTDSVRFEQAYSDDGGRTWEVNWIAVDTRIRDGDNR